MGRASHCDQDLSNQGETNVARTWPTGPTEKLSVSADLDLFFLEVPKRFLFRH
jgi:hypothetical protein